MPGKRSRNLTISLDPSIVRYAKRTAARDSMSTSESVSQKLEDLVSDDKEYQRAKRHALAPLEKGFHLGGKIPVSRDEFHQR